LYQNEDGKEPQATALNGQILNYYFSICLDFSCDVVVSGCKLPLLEVITKCLNYIKDEAIRDVNSSQMVPVKHDDIQWLVTVPAIWSDVAKVRRSAVSTRARM
jgi:hypothetical protein